MFWPFLEQCLHRIKVFFSDYLDFVSSMGWQEAGRENSLEQLTQINHTM